MVISIKDLVKIMDKNIKYVEEANVLNVNDDDYQEYMEKMQRILTHQVQELERISSNEALINRYFNKINHLFNIELKRTEQQANSGIGEAFERLVKKHEFNRKEQ